MEAMRHAPCDCGEGKPGAGEGLDSGAHERLSPRGSQLLATSLSNPL